MMMSGIDFSVSSNCIGEFGDHHRHQQQTSQLYHNHHHLLLPLNPNPIPNPIIQNVDSSSSLPPSLPKKKRNLPGKPDPDAEVIALSPNTLMATNRFICEVCNKGFQRDQNLQLHRRGHNLPWKLRQRSSKEAVVVKKKVYICPEKGCVHHDPSRALGDLTGIKKHYSRKHGEKKWKCEKCCKKYAVQSDWKAHSKTCGTRDYKCDCGTLFSRKDSFITHRAFCDALAEESAKLISSVTSPNSRLHFIANNNNNSIIKSQFLDHNFESSPLFPQILSPTDNLFQNSNQILSLNNKNNNHNPSKTAIMNLTLSSFTHKQQQQQQNVAAYDNSPSFRSVTGGGGGMSATALLLKAAQLGSTKSDDNSFCSGSNSVGVVMSSSSSSKNISIETNGNYFGGKGNGLRDFFGRKELGEGNNDELIIPSMEMTKFANSMSSEMGFSQFIGNNSVG
ncbi:hypothetical protein IC575_020535 [Cucumis melo]|uniref:Zinc finger protein BALDIBIS n=3 Tax=Cucumis melo TaxID=3656 RepID=A0A1S3BM97_CUCME|nr:zinc finger protein BALDIBIS [Cucumis melo]